MYELAPPKKMHVRELVKLTKDEVWKPYLNNTISVVELAFDDGTVVETNDWYNSISWYYLQVFKHYPEVTIDPSMHLGLVSSSSSKLMSILSSISYACFDQAHANLDFGFSEILGELIYQLHMDMYNDCVTDTGYIASYVDVTDIFDFCAVANIPEIIEINKGITPDARSITEATDAIGVVMTKYADQYQIASHFSDELVNRKQIGQIFGPIGYRNGVGGDIYSRPITTGIMAGMRDQYDILIDSVTASIAILNEDEPLSASEYSNRRMDLSSMYVSLVEVGDCGNTDYTRIPHRIVRNLSPEVLLGMHVLHEGELEVVTRKNAKELMQSDVYLRSAISCKHPDPSKVCSVCYGDLYKQIPKWTNIGNVAQVSTGTPKTNTMMSFKHHMGSSAVSKISMGEDDLTVLTPTLDNLALTFNSTLAKQIDRNKDSKLLIEVNTKSVNNLGDINQNDIDNINIFNVSNLSKATFIIKIPGEMDAKHSINLGFGSRECSFSKHALKHIKTANYGISSRGQYIFDFTNFPKDKALFKLPRKFDNTLVTVREIDQVYLGGNGSSKEGGAKGKSIASKYSRGCKLVPIHKYATKHEALIAQIEFLNAIYPLHVTHISVIIKAYLCKGVDDYRMARGDEPYVIGPYHAIMLKRSIGASLAYQSQEIPFTDPARFQPEDIDPHPFDQILRG